MIDEFLKKTGVGIALLFMIIELSYVNTLSLVYMLSSENKATLIALFFGIVGAIAFSIVTVLVMRLSKRKWLKIAFPIFDGLLVFCGFNLKHADNLLDNPIRFALSIFLAVFSALITYSLGEINAEQHTEGNPAELERENKLLKSKNEELQRNYDNVRSELKVSFEKHSELKSNYNNVVSNFEKTKTYVDELRGNIDELKNYNAALQSQLHKAAAEAARYKGAAMAAEVARIRKKAEKNRTVEELELLNSVMEMA